jgi:hypothetical protein
MPRRNLSSGAFLVRRQAVGDSENQTHRYLLSASLPLFRGGREDGRRPTAPSSGIFHRLDSLSWGVERKAWGFTEEERAGSGCPRENERSIDEHGPEGKSTCGPHAIRVPGRDAGRIRTPVGLLPDDSRSTTHDQPPNPQPTHRNRLFSRFFRGRHDRSCTNRSRPSSDKCNSLFPPLSPLFPTIPPLYVQRPFDG